ncbi:MAG: RsmB/NOP family class I SAM-dependent RNA methyltransferase [Myxococcales bacterium]|nr:RsmB/NOP family class I SAM-dependent RNA methyltransferase [Myxococcales bacterium]
MSSQDIIEARARRAVELVTSVEASVLRGEPADVALSRSLRRDRRLGGRDRRFISETVFSHFRWRGWLERLQSLSLDARCALAYLLDARETSPVAERLLARGGLAPDCLAPQGGRTVIEKGVALRKALGERVPPYLPGFAPELRSLVPAWALECIHRPGGEPEERFAEKLVEAFQNRPPTWLSLPSSHHQTLIQLIGSKKSAATRHPAIESALGFSGSPDLELARAKLGAFFWVQDLASQAIARFCEPRLDESWWDACAGAGGKTLALLQLTHARLRVLATDRRAGVLQNLRRRVEEARLGTVATGVIDALCDSPQDRQFDGILVDAPCSGLGTWNRNPDARWRTERDEPNRKALLQQKLLDRVCGKVRKGGKLVYAVCTLSEAETVKVVSAFLAEHKEFSLLAGPHPLGAEPTDGNLWIWPWQGPCDGMFAARFVRDS